MRRFFLVFSFVAAVTIVTNSLAQPPAAKQGPVPDPKIDYTDFVDASTGHRIIRLTPDSGGNCLYFHQNMYTPEGDKFLFKGKGGIMAVDIKDLGKTPPKSELIAANATLSFTARKTRDAYFLKGKSMWAVNIDTKVQREVTKEKFTGGTHTPLNCDETYVVAAIDAVDPSGKTPKPPPHPEISKNQRERMFGDKIKAGIPLTAAEERAYKFEETLLPKAIEPPPMAFVFTNIKSGEAKTVAYQHGWLNHIQFSPTDPNLLLYCHEGTWHEVDRVFVVRTDGTGMKLLSPRTMEMEISGHEFWSGDGKIVWWDHQTPRSKEFWVTGVDVYNGDRYSYHVERDEWSGHYNVSQDGKVFCGTGGGPGSVAFAENGQWIYAFTPVLDEEMTKKKNVIVEGKQVKYGDFIPERLVNQKLHRNTLDPQVTLTPDGKWVIFASNMSGATHVYAVEVKKSDSKPK